MDREVFWNVIEGAWRGAPLRERVKAGRTPVSSRRFLCFATRLGRQVDHDTLAPALREWRAAAHELTLVLNIPLAEACYCVAIGREACTLALMGHGVPEDRTDGFFEALIAFAD